MQNSQDKNKYRKKERPEFRKTTPEEGNENHLEGRNAVLEAFRSGRTVDKVFLQKDLHDGSSSFSVGPEYPGLLICHPLPPAS